MPKSVIETEEAPAAIGPYSQAIKTANFVFTSGQLPIDPATNRLVSKSIEKQTSQCFENLIKVLSAAETSLDQVVKINVYLKDLSDFPLMNQIYNTFFKSAPPARSCIQAAGLPMDASIEIEAVAICPIV